MKTVIPILVVMVLLCASAEPLQARPQWFSIGAGGSNEGFAWGAGYSVLGRRLMFCVRGAFSYRSGWVFLDNGGRDLGALIGVYTSNHEGEHLSIAAGLGVVAGYHDVEKRAFNGRIYMDEEEFSTVGLLIQLQGYGAGRIGVLGFANLNTKSSFVGGLVAWRFGQFR